MEKSESNHEKTVTNIYLSPSGSTRKAGSKIASLLEEKGYTTREFNLARYNGNEKEVHDAIASSSVLLAGSPVHTGNAVSPVLEFLKGIPGGAGKPAVAYVTYGTVSKGDSLFQLARLLENKGYKVKGLAEIVAEHSMMFKSRNPFGRGRPDGRDMATLESWADSLVPAIEENNGRSLDYMAVKQQQLFGRLMLATAFRPELRRFIFPPARFREEKCNSCGACAGACPAGRLDNLPRIDNSRSCLYCYQCVNTCSEGAMTSPLWIMQPVLKVLALVSRGSEEPETRCHV